MKEVSYAECTVVCDKNKLRVEIARMVHFSAVENREKGLCTLCYDGEKIWTGGWGEECVLENVLFTIRTLNKKKEQLVSRSNVFRQVVVFFKTDERVQFPVSLTRISFVMPKYSKTECKEKEARLKAEAKEKLRLLRESLGISKKKKKKKPRELIGPMPELVGPSLPISEFTESE